jgi:hypothetical protein
MSVTIEYHEGAVTYLSDAGQAAYEADRQRQADEQRMNRVDRLYVEIRLGALGGALLTIAGLIVKQIWSLT